MRAGIRVLRQPCGIVLQAAVQLGLPRGEGILGVLQDRGGEEKGSDHDWSVFGELTSLYAYSSVYRAKHSSDHSSQAYLVSYTRVMVQDVPVQVWICLVTYLTASRVRAQVSVMRRDHTQQ